MRRIKKIILWFGGFLVFFTLFGFFVLPPVLKMILVKKLSENLHRQVTIQKIKINPYALTLDVKGFLVKERSSADKFVYLDEVFVNLSSISLAKRAVVLEELWIGKPYFKVVRRKDESYNFSDLMGKPKPEPPEPEKKTKPVNFSLNNITVSGGSVDFIDGPKDTNHTVRNLNITIPSISNRPHDIDIFVQPKLSVDINGKNFSLQGKTKLFADSRQTNLDITLKDIDLAHYLPYVPMKLNVKLPSAVLDVNAKLLFIRYKDKGPALELTGNIDLGDIGLDDLENKPILRLSSARIDLGSLRPLSKNFHLAKIILQSPELSVRRGKTGKINLQSLVGQEAETATQKDAKTVSTPSKDSGLPLVVIDQFQIQQGKLSFNDDMPAEPVTLNVNDLTLQVDNLSTAKGSKGMLSLSLALEKQGSLSLKGPVSIDPLNAELAVDTKDVALDTFQPYFTDKVKIHLTDGSFSTEGNLGVIDSGPTGLKINYSGTALVANFASVDKENGKDFLNWKSLFFDSINAGTNPLSVDIKGISLTDFYSRVAINSDGTLNVQQVVGGEKPAPTSPPAQPAQQKQASATTGKETQDINIEKITLQGGRVDFSDSTVKPRYSTQLRNLGGRISGLSLGKNKTADVELRGKMGSDVPLEIVGKINPSSDNFFVDLTAKFRGMDLSPMTPYSGKYIGYTIEKGKLSLDVKYLIVNKKLESQNKIFFDQFTLGDKVESKDAVQLPVKLAISLLKDQNGKIDLDIPVSGNLDDPQFSVWQIIMKVLKNILVKAATAPFALIGSLFGGGEDLSYIEFDYGIARVNDENLKKIDNMVKALSGKPSLQIEITGYSDAENDPEGLKTYYLNQKVKAQKLQKSGKKGKGTSVDDVIIEPEEYEKYLTLAYKAAKFPKPRMMVGLLKKLPVPEMEKLMLTNTKITDDDLRALANQRAVTVKELITKSGQVTPDRIFIIEPKSLTPEKKENIKNSRVDFSLKQ